MVTAKICHRKKEACQVEKFLIAYANSLDPDHTKTKGYTHRILQRRTNSADRKLPPYFSFKMEAILIENNLLPLGAMLSFKKSPKQIRRKNYFPLRCLLPVTCVFV